MRREVLVLRRHNGFSTILEEKGIGVVNLELIKTKPLADQSELRELLTGRVVYDGIFVTSPVAAGVLVGCLRDLGRSFPGKIYVLGDRSRQVFDDAGIDVESSDGANTASELIAAFKDGLEGKRFCFLRGDRSMRAIPDLLRGKAVIEEVVVYRTIEAEVETEIVSDIRGRLRNGEFDWACFFSPSAVEAFETAFGSVSADRFRAAAIGTTTAHRAAELGFDVAFVSPRANAEAFAHGFAERVNEH